MKKLLSPLLLALLLGFSGLPALAQTAGTALTTQLIVTRVVTAGLDTPTPTIGIDGLNFNATTSRVYLGTAAGLYQELVVQSRTATKIVAELNTTTPGGYVLKVSAGTAAAQNFSVDLTLGATGAPGAAGADGAGFLFRAAFLPATAYLRNDVVTYLGNTYVATQDFVSVANPDVNTTHWTLFVPQGATGPEGPAGATGPQGIQGLMGVAGPAGATGAQGAQGIQGLPGATGSDGAAGLPGAAGPQGIPGATGPAGPVGPAGATGAQGSQGIQGLTGTTGATGAQGPQGIPGATGATGAAGPQGIPGPNEPTGNITLLESTSAGVGSIFKGTTRFIHNFGTNNTFIGKGAGNFSMTGLSNTASGSNALQQNTTGNSNTASGKDALASNTTGSSNSASGAFALVSNTTGSSNTANGAEALTFNTTGFGNTAGGVNALFNNTTGGGNTALGLNALNTNTTGTNNTTLGNNSDVSTGNLTNATAIGNGAVVNASNKIRLGNSSVTVLEAQVGLTVVSDRHAKEEFRTPDAEDILQKIGQVPVTTWNYIGHDPKLNRHYGPMAQDFYAAFGHDGVGHVGDDTSINSSDLSGILMVAVQALEKRTAGLTSQNEDLRAQNEDLRARLQEQEALKERLEKLERLFGAASGR
jgi:hypothetical protein